MQLTHWDEKPFSVAHRFSMNKKTIADGASKCIVKGKVGVIAPADIIAAIQLGNIMIGLNSATRLTLG